MKNRVFILTVLVLVLIFYGLIINQNLIHKGTAKTPKLVVGIVIDQMRADYLYRFNDNYNEGGFKRLIREGFNVKNLQYNYVPTATGPGHASIFSGTFPASHGIIANDWYDRKSGKIIYCTKDDAVDLVDNVGQIKEFPLARHSASPKQLEVSTITDELKLFTNNRAKVIGISLKDRSAIFPAGHLADGAYWYNSNNGNFVTSTFYRGILPKWLVEFNKQNKADSLLNLTWNPSIPLNKYIQSVADDDEFEKVFNGRKKSMFPYKLNELRHSNENFGLLTKVPFGNSLLTELAMAAIKGEHLGKDRDIDFLTISYSSTDNIGHQFGIRSKELEDTYVKMDLEIEKMMNFLDSEVGDGNYLVFLTADHGASDHPNFLNSRKLPGKFYNPNKMRDEINDYLSKRFEKGNYVKYMDKMQIYFGRLDVQKNPVVNETIKFLRRKEGVNKVYVPRQPIQSLEGGFGNYIDKNGYHSKKSGDIIYEMDYGWMEMRSYGTTHGTSHRGDTHVPLLWYGAKIPKGQTMKKKYITQIAPTLAMLLDIPLPSHSDLNPIYEIFEQK